MKRIAIVVVNLLLGIVGFAQTDVDTVTISDNVNKDNQSAVNGQWSMFNEIIGYLSYDSALVAMPEYAAVMQQMADTRTAYNEEMKRVENEFNSKYEEFLENRRTSRVLFCSNVRQNCRSS